MPHRAHTHMQAKRDLLYTLFNIQIFTF